MRGTVPFDEQEIYYPGPRGFFLFFIGKFCDANRFFYFFFFFVGDASIVSSQIKKDNIKRKPLGPG